MTGSSPLNSNTDARRSVLRLPNWLKVDLPGRGDYHDIRAKMRDLKLNTVCEEARCPNIAACWGGGTATFMIMGRLCTRGCRFCDVDSGKPTLPPDPNEPKHLADAAKAMGLKYVVITSVDRDDIPDQGCAHFEETVRVLKQTLSDATVELLTPDFQGDRYIINRVGRSGAEVLAHNLETVRSLTRSVRDRRCSYDQTLDVLNTYRRISPTLVIKSSLMLGLGEDRHEVIEAMHDLKDAGVDWITLGQYLRPSRKHAPVQRYVHPDEFSELEEEALKIGFDLAACGPLVRSSYRAAEFGAKELIDARKAPTADALSHK